MRKAFLHITQRILLLVLALQVLNLSINAIDFKPIASTDISEFNDLNTLSEYFTEVILGYTNAFPESVQKEQKQSQLQKHMAVKLTGPSFSGYTVNTYSASVSFLFPENENDNRLFSQEINPPPPKA